MSRTFRILFLLLLVSVSVQAQRFSYVYIQGDKQTPFYVKLNGEMQPRYGKNYCILPQLEAGTIKIEILFQQNAYPAQQFTIQVPESSNRSFMITRKDQNFSLYDLQQHFYLPAGNAESDDHLPAAPVAAATTNKKEEEITEAEPQPAIVKNEEVVPSPKKTEEAPKEIIKEAEPTEEVSNRRTRRNKESKQTVDTPVATTNDQPQFLDNVKLSNEHEQSGNPTTATGAITDTVFTQKKPLDISFHNSDCPQPMADADFERIYKTMMQKADDEGRVDYLNGQLDKCYQTWQARTLGTLLTEDAARFTFLKNVYPHITDQQAFPLLDDMLRSDVWKQQFNQLTHR